MGVEAALLNGLNGSLSNDISYQNKFSVKLHIPGVILAKEQKHTCECFGS